MNSPHEGAPAPDAPPEDVLPEDVAAEEVPPPIPFYQRPAWKKVVVVGLVVAVFFLIGLVFTPAYFRF